MGNSTPYNSEALESGIFAKYEHNNGKKILQAIRSNNVDKAIAAIDTARKEFIKPTVSAPNDAEYEKMVRGMMKYLTQQYDIGEGVVFTKTLLEYCDMCESNDVKQEIQKEIVKYKDFDKRLEDLKPMDRVTADRARSAREKLKAFQETRKK